jgi:hypothetical protein
LAGRQASGQSIGCGRTPRRVRHGGQIDGTISAEEDEQQVGRAQLPSGSTTGIGSLPHRDADEAAAFALTAMALPAVPSLPKRSPAEGMIAQALVGVRGFSLGPYGSMVADVERLDPDAPVVTDLEHSAFGGFRAFLDAAAGRTAPVKWQMVGPLTLGLAIVRSGAPVEVAFDVAVGAVRARLLALHAHVAAALPDCDQVVFIDEPSFGELMHPGFPLAPDAAIDFVSGALAAIEPLSLAGVHVAADADIASLLAAGPSILSVPVDRRLAGAAGYLMRHLAAGGTIAWGVVSTDGPISTSVERPWRDLTTLWCDLVAAGVDPVLLRTRSLVSPARGLAAHSVGVAQRVHRVVAEVGTRVRDQAIATRFALGA